MVENGVQADILLAGQYGHHLHIWDLPRRRHKQAIDLGKEQQMVLELMPAHDPTKAYGFVGVVTSLADLIASVRVWYLEGGQWSVKKGIVIPAQAAVAEKRPSVI